MNQSQIDALLDGPALAPPPGIQSNLVNPPESVVLSYVVTTLTIAIATVAVFVRMYTRIFITKQVGFPDYVLVIGWALFAGFIGDVYRVAQYGPGIHQWDISLRNLSSFLFWYHYGAIIYGLVICFVKLSILAQYIQIFMPTKNPPVLYWTTIFIIVANVITYIIFTFMEIFACDPINKAWDPLVTGGHCLDTRAFNTITSSVNLGSDFIILVLPQIVIWRLNMSWKNKTSVSLAFLVAVLAIVSSAVRLHACVLLQHSEDLTYYSWLAGIWALPEIMFGIVVASIPAFRPFFNHLAQTPFFTQITSGLHRLTTRSKPGSGKGPTAYMLDDRISAWPPGAGSGRTWVHAAYGGDMADSGSREGLRVETTIETSIEDRRL